MSALVLAMQGKYVACQDTLSMLRTITTPIAVVAVAGSYRSGKSSFLNVMMNKHCFSTSASTQSHTKGLWLAEFAPGIWLMDTEGLGSTQSEDMHDYTIFRLAVLLGSVLVFNHMGPITSSALQSLRLAGKLANELKRVAGKKISLSPTTLLWLARDFNFEMLDEHNNPIDADTYLETNAATLPGILDLFPQRKCFTLPRPAKNDHDVATLRNPTPEFMAAIQGVREFLQGVRPKLCQAEGCARNGEDVIVPLTGTMFASLVETLVDVINSGAANIELVPVWDSVVRDREREARARAMDNMQKILASESEEPTHVLETTHEILKQYESSVYDPNVSATLSLLQDLAHLEKKDFEKKCQEFEDDPSKLSAVPSHARRFAQVYSEFATQPLQERIRELSKTVEHQQGETERQRHAFENKLNELEEMAKKKQEEFQKQAEEAQHKVESDWEQHKELQKQYAALAVLHEEYKQENESLTRELTESSSALVQCRAKIQHLEPELALIREDLTHQRSQLATRMSELRVSVQTLRSSTETAQRRAEQAEEQMNASQNQLRESESKAKHDIAKHTEYLTVLQGEKRQLEKQMEETKERLRHQETHLAVEKAKAETLQQEQSKRQKLMSNATELQELRKVYEHACREMRELSTEKAQLTRKVLELEVQLVTAGCEKK